MNLLHVDSSILGDQSVSRKITAAAVDALRAENPGLIVAYRDLAASPPAHLSGEVFGARVTPPDQRTPEQVAALAVSDAILNEFMAADVVVVGAPMYNFAIPSQLKTWIDHLAAPGVTFAYGESGPKGLAGGKRVILASTRGGFYGADTPAAFLEHQESFLRGFFAFIGITDIEVIGAEGLAVSPELKQQATDTAVAEARALQGTLVAA